MAFDREGYSEYVGELNQQKEEQESPAPAEEKPSFWALLTDSATYQKGQELANEATLESNEAAGNILSETAQAVGEAVSSIPDAYGRLMAQEQAITAAYTPDKVEEANETGDYSEQQQAVETLQEEGSQFGQSLWETAGAFTRPLRERIGAVEDDAAENGSESAQNMRDTSTFIDYFMSDEQKLSKARQIEALTGIPADAALADTQAMKSALEVYDYAKKQKAVLGDAPWSMDAVWQEYPELRNIADMSPQDAALALHQIDEVRRTHGIIDSWQTMLEYGNKELEYGNLQYKIMQGKADENDLARAAQLEEQLKNQKKTLPSVFDDPLAAIVGGVASSTPMMYQSIMEAGQDAAAWTLAASAAGAGAGSVLPGVGTAAGALAGGATGATRFAYLFLSNLARYSSGASFARTMGETGAKLGMLEGMRRPTVGQDYAEYKEMEDAEGNPLLTDEQAKDYATVAGTLNAGIEMANFGVALRALKGAPHTHKMLADIIKGATERQTAQESLRLFAMDRGADVLKVTASEAGEEGLQSISDDLVHNKIEADTGDTSNGVYSFRDIAARGLQSSLEALPASFGFGVLSGFGGTVTGGIGKNIAMRDRARFEARYSKEERETLMGSAMYEQLQQAVAQSNIKEENKDIQRKVIRQQLANTKFSTVYVETETALEKENGMDDLKAVAKAANISDEDLQTAIDEKGTLTVPGEQFAQAASSPDLLESVSFSPKADSIARMRKDAKATLAAMEEREKASISRKMNLQQAILDEYYPEEKAGAETMARREALQAVMMQNPENPAQGWNDVRKEYRARLDELLAPALRALKEGMGKGGQYMETEDENGNKKTLRFTENAEWYRNFYQIFGRKPTAQELEDMAIALTTGDESAPKVEGFIPTTKEEADGMAAMKPEIEDLKKKIATLDDIKQEARQLNGVEMELTEGLSKDGFHVYRTVMHQLQDVGGAPARAARMDAILFARHADIVADIISKKTGKKYTALDYMRERYGLETGEKHTPEYAEYAQSAMYRNPADTLSKFIDNVMQGKSGKSYFDYDVNGYKVRITSDDVVHVQKGSHPLSKQDWHKILEGMKNGIQKAVLSKQAKRPRGESLALKIVTPQKMYGVAVEFANGSLIYIRTAFYSTDKNLDAWMKKNKREAGVRRYPGFPSHTAEAGSNHAITTSHSLSISSIQQALGIDKRFSQMAGERALTANQQAFVLGKRLQAAERAWGQNLDDFIAGKLKTNIQPVIMDAPMVLSLIGAKSGIPIKVRQGTMRKILKDLESANTHGHGGEISVDVFKKLPSLLSNPIMVLRSRSNRNGENAIIPNGYTFIVEATDRDNRTIIVPITLEADENSYVLKTFYGKKDIAKWLEGRVLHGDVLYMNTEKNPQLLESTHLAPMARRLPKAEDFLEYILQHRTKEIKTEKDLSKLKSENPAFYQMAWHIEKFNQEKNRGRKGYITPYSDGRRVITLLEEADESTFLHEMGHMFLMDLEDLAQIDEVSKKELELVDAWANWEKGAAKEYKETPWKREFREREQGIIDAKVAGDHDTADRLKRKWRQERFARAFELYLREGKAPARGLRAVFRNFKQFLRVIYEAFAGDGGHASLPVQRVMARMIATEEEIEEMSLDDRYKDVTKAGGEKLLDEDDAKTYARWREGAIAEAKEKLMKIVMKDLTEKKEREFEERVKRERERKRRELQNEPVYLATQAVVASGGDENIVKNWYGSVEEYLEEASKVPPIEEALDAYMEQYTRALDEELIESHLSEEAVRAAMDSSEYADKLQSLVSTAFAKKQALIRTITTKTKRAMQSIEDKLTALPEDVDLKLNKTDKAVKDIMKAVNRLRFSAKWKPEDYVAIENMIHAATKEDLRNELKKFKEAKRVDKENEKAVMEANEGRMKVYRDIAEKAMKTKTVAEIIDVRHYENEQRRLAARVRQMIKAKRWDMAMQAQQQMALSAAMGKRAAKAREDVMKQIKRIKEQLNARSVRLPKDERYWHRHLAYVLRLVKKDVQKPESGCVSLHELFENMELGLDIQEAPKEIFEIVAQGDEFRGWSSLKYDELKQALDALTIIYTVGRDKFRMKTIGGKDIEEVVSEICAGGGDAGNIETREKKVEENEGGLGYNDWLAKVPGVGRLIARQGQGFLAAMIKPEEVLRALGPAAHRYLYGIYEKAAQEEGARIEQEYKTLKDILSRYSHSERRAWKEKKYSFQAGKNGEKELWSKENIICAALNLGTKTNVQRLAGGLGVDGEKIKFFVESHMTKKDWMFVQDLWDHISSYWKETVAVEERLNGVALKKTKAVPFSVMLPDGEMLHMKGGYYPVKFNPEKSGKAAEQELNAAAMGTMSGAQALGTRRSFTKSRTKYDVFRPLLLEFSVIPEHLQNVIHNITYRIPARDVYRLVTSRKVEEYVAGTLGREYYDVLKEWATDVWNILPGTESIAERKVDRVFGALCRNSVMAIMGYRIWPVIENVSNIGPVMDKLGAANGLAAVADFYAHYDEAKKLLYKSVFMRNRINSMDRDIGRQEGMFEADARPFEIIRSHAYDLMLYSDLALSAPLWVRAYKDAYTGKVAEVKRENEANIQAVTTAQQAVDSIRARIHDLSHNVSEINKHLGVRKHGTAKEIEDARHSPFAISTEEDLRAEAAGNTAKIKELDRGLYEAEAALQKATERDILTDEEVLKEAERRAIAQADAAIRDTFGSGQTQDLSSIQRQRGELYKLMTTFYSFFNTQFNAIFAAYRHGKFGLKGESMITRWAPFARAVFYRLVVMSLIGSMLKFALGVDGGDDKDKYRKVKNPQTGKEERVEVSALERFLRVFGNNLLSTATGSFVGVRDIANLAITYLFDGTTYGRGINPISTAFKPFEELGKTIDLLARKGKKDLEIEEQHAKKRQAQQKRLKKLRGKARQEYLKKIAEQEKYKHPDQHITYSEIARHGLNAASTFTAAHTGITNTLMDAITGTMQYMNDTDNRYEGGWNIVWSAVFDKKPVEREIPKKPEPAPETKKDKRKKKK